MTNGVNIIFVIKVNIPHMFHSNILAVIPFTFILLVLFIYKNI